MAEISRARGPRPLLFVAWGVGVVLATTAVWAGLSSGLPSGETGSAAPATQRPSATQPTGPIGPIGPVIPPAGGAPAVPSTAAPVGPRTTTEVEPAGVPKIPLPPSSPIGPLVSGPLPASATSTGALVVGFPSAIPLPSGSTISVSSVSSNGNILTAMLAAKTATGPDELVTWFSDRFARLSLAGTPAPAVGGSTAIAFLRGGESVTLTVTSAGTGGSRFTLIGTFARGGS